MAKKVTGMIKLQLPAGKATPAPPVGPALGQHGVNIMGFCKEFNAKTANQAGLIIPVVITVYQDRSFSFILKTPPAAVLIKKELGLESGSGVPNRTKVGTLTKDQVRKIAELKMPDLNAATIETAMSMIEALDLAVKTAKAKFDETIELHVRLGVDPRHADQQVRGAVVLPNGTGKTVKVLVFAKGAKATEAQEAGADFVGAEELVQKIQGENWFDYDVVVATPDMMGVVGRLGRVLGPKGLMPNPKSGTVTFDVAKAIADIKAGKVEYRVDKTAIVHCPIGKASFGVEKLQQNFHALMDALVKAKPAAAKGQYVKSVSVSSTMGPGAKINPTKVLD